jgi:hypothetical protein
MIKPAKQKTPEKGVRPEKGEKGAIGAKPKKPNLGQSKKKK